MDSPANHAHEQPSARIRAFLARTTGLDGCSFADDAQYQRGRMLVQCLAVAYRVGDASEWDATDCADVLRFLSSIQPVEHTCFCNDGPDHAVNATCGFHEVLTFAEAQMRRIVVSIPKAHRARPVSGAAFRVRSTRAARTEVFRE